MSMMIREAALSNHNEKGGSVDHAVRAAENCIKEAGINKQDIDLLINTGVYRDQNIAEPAIATLIQKELCLNVDPVPSRTAKMTFSFDLMNGACGFLYAAQVADSFIRTHEKQLVLIVSSEVHPSKKLSPDFPYTHIGSAVLLQDSKKGDRGFKHFMFETSNKEMESYTGYIDIWDEVKCGPRGRDSVSIDIAPDYAEKLEKHVLGAIKEHVKSGEIDPSEIDLIITSQSIPGLGGKISKSIGLKEISSISTYEEFGNAGSSDLAIGYCMARKKEILKKGDKILFVGAGSGLTAALAVYEV
jgi:3-oxoacyl-[acyl-carrier-protein] synthase-3